MIDVLAAEAAEVAELEKQQTTPKAGNEPEPKHTEPDGEGALEPEQPEEQAEAQGKPNPGRLVRQRDYLEAQERYKSAEARARELEARYASDMSRVNERLAIIAQTRAEAERQAQPQIEIPDKNVDPIGYFEAKQAILEQKLAEAEIWRNQQAKASDDDEKRAKIGAEVSRLEAKYAETTPDYPQAQEFLQQKWAAQAALLGATPQQAIRFYAEQIVRAAASQNRNPAEVAYEFAKQLGYAKPNGNGAAKASGPDLETIARGVAVSKSTSTAPGKSVAGEMNAKALLEMDDDEFAAKFGARESKDWNRTMRKLMGV